MPFARATLSALLLACLALLAAPASAIDRKLCKDDGVTQVPGFAEGRDGDQCLMIDPGNGDASVPFQYETFDKTGIGVGCGEPKNSGVQRIEHNLDTYGRCPTQGKGEYCSQIFWNVTFDNYLDPACKNEDVLFFAPGTALQYLYFKDSQILNSWKCAGGSGWKGPNGIECRPGEDSGSHTDGIQMRGLPTAGGWVVFQDSVFANGYNYHFLNQTQPLYGKGSMLFQGTHFGRIQSVGEASTYVDDCHARRPNNADNPAICDRGRTSLGTSMKEIWFVDTFGTSRFNLKGDFGKVVIVNSGCDDEGCNGTIGYSNGWPHPLDGSGSGPGKCPNGPIPTGGVSGGVVGGAYCYTSLENALADGHQAPPFVQLSAAGWDDPPSGSTPPRPFPVRLLDE